MNASAGPTSEQKSREVAEASRQKEWKAPSFLRELFLGSFRLDLIHPYPVSAEERPEFAEYYTRFRRFLIEEVDSIRIDEEGDYPEEVVEGLRRLGAFGMKIPREYGGLGFSQVEYARVMQLLGSRDGNLSALLSAHQSIGVPQPLKLFGSEALKKKYLPRCAAGEISAFALTESHVGSDPARLSTRAELTPQGDAYILNGTKLWCTNGTLATLLVVMAVDSQTEKISAFVVETDWPGVRVERRCHFMGLRALANAVISFKDVRLPRENLIGEAGRGLKIALTTLNDGRLSIPNGAVGGAKICLQICRKWSNERVQWGKPIGQHEAVAHMISRMAVTTFAMESVAQLATEMSDRGGYDIRLEAAAAKEWNSCRGWEIIDDTMQIRGGRGYEKESSLAARGEEALGVERMMRDFRINKIFEGSSEIMHLFMAREAVDKHLQVAGTLVDPKSSLATRLKALPGIASFYAWWYPTRWAGWALWPRYSEFGDLAPHLRFIDRQSRKLARQVFHGMVIHGPRLQNKQAFLFRLVDIANELFAMAASLARAHTLRETRGQDGKEAVHLAALFCRQSRRKTEDLFRDLWSNDDVRLYKSARRFLEGKQSWIEEGVWVLDELLQAGTSKAPLEQEGQQPDTAPIT